MTSIATDEQTETERTAQLKASSNALPRSKASSNALPRSTTGGKSVSMLGKKDDDGKLDTTKPRRNSYSGSDSGSGSESDSGRGSGSDTGSGSDSGSDTGSGSSSSDSNSEGEKEETPRDNSPKKTPNNSKANSSQPKPPRNTNTTNFSESKMLRHADWPTDSAIRVILVDREQTHFSIDDEKLCGESVPFLITKDVIEIAGIKTARTLFNNQPDIEDRKRYFSVDGKKYMAFTLSQTLSMLERQKQTHKIPMNGHTLLETLEGAQFQDREKVVSVRPKKTTTKKNLNVQKRPRATHTVDDDGDNIQGASKRPLKKTKPNMTFETEEGYCVLKATISLWPVFSENEKKRVSGSLSKICVNHLTMP